jgi:hypothetical protein
LKTDENKETITMGHSMAMATRVLSLGSRGVFLRMFLNFGFDLKNSKISLIYIVYGYKLQGRIAFLKYQNVSSGYL